MQVYERAEVLSRVLRESGRVETSRRIDDAISAAATGLELVMAVRHIALQVLDQPDLVSEDIVELAEELVSQADALLS